MYKELIEIAENFKESTVRFLKRNLNLIVILPALFGGLWQVIELSRMSFSFIRFFSVGQIIPDGLLILLVLIIFSISTLILIYYWKKLDSEDDTNEDVSTPKKGNLSYSVLFFLLFIGLAVLIVYANNYFINNIESIISLFFYLPVNIVVTLFSFVSLHYFIQYSKDIHILNRYRKVLLEMRLFTFYIQVFMFLLFVIKFHDVFMLPIELKNVDNLICKMEKIDESANIEILYSNDKYIFVKCHKFTKDRNGRPRQSEIRIFRFEELLDDSSCIGSKRIRAEFVKDSIWDSKQPAKLKD
jgi:hypothetical protein